VEFSVISLYDFCGAKNADNIGKTAKRRRRSFEMRKIKRNFGFIIAFGLIILGLASHALAQNQNAVKTMRQINIKFEDFRYNLNENLINGNFSRPDQDEVKDLMNNLEDSIVDFDNKLQKNTENKDDISAVNSASDNLDNFISRSRFDSKVTRSWNDLRGLFTKLSSDYGNGSNNTGNNYPSDTGSRTGLTGTYRLDTARSDNAEEIVGEAIRNASDAERRAAEKHLAEKLRSPEMMAFDIRGNQVSIGSTRSPQVTVNVNESEKIQRNADGKNVRVQSTLNRDELTISIEQEAQNGNRLRDYSYVVTFSPYENGKSMRVVRRLTDDEVNQTFIVTSYYEKTSDVARLDIYNNSNSTDDDGWSSNTDKRPSTDYPPTTTNNRRTGDFVIADGVILTALLQDNVSTKVSQDGDRFRLRVEAPSQYRGAIIEGTVSSINRSGKVVGNPKLTFNFEKIRLTNGRIYDFAGFVQNITDAYGKTVKIDEEGTATGKSQTKETIKRGGIGAGAGAIIGAIFGGAKGAVIGAVIGGGGGAGSVIVTGKHDIELTQGSSLTIQSSSPIR
jgi:hypothetical protein